MPDSPRWLRRAQPGGAAPQRRRTLDQREPGAAGQPDVEKQRDRIVTLRAALLTAIAGLAAGLIGGLAGLAGAVISSQSEATRAHDDFLRTQRQTSYSRFILDE